ncbi:hypothetical protein BC830DRAFT_1116567 [Chytriomyces sp. MP71]|nr:hypothetical protein BC830DRAFT_1116567 [Chytriomyces sp. MP71]
MVPEEEFDENYEPSQEEIIEYAKFLGMDEDEDKHLFWIARESLKAPLPPDWKPCQSDDGNIYYFNFSTGESIWDHPCDEHYRQLYEREKGKPADVRHRVLNCCGTESSDQVANRGRLPQTR